MANDLEQKARALLAAEVAASGRRVSARAIRHGDLPEIETGEALRAIAAALQQAQQPRNSRIDAGSTPSGESPESWDAVDEALLHWYGHAMTFSQSERQRFFDAIQKFMRHRAQQQVVVSNDGTCEAQFIADGRDLNCPACGDSGHIDDAQQPGAQPECNVEGSWLWCKLMDWCKQQRIVPTTQNALFAIAAEAHKLYTAPPPPPLPEGVSEDAIERVAALLYTEATDEPWLVAGVAHKGFDHYYYRDLARRVLAAKGGV